MLRRVQIIVGALVILAMVIWLIRSERPGVDTVETVRPQAPERDTPPRLIGTGEAATVVEETSPETEEPVAPTRPWETRPGFDVGKNGDVRAFGRVVGEDGRRVEDALVWKAYAYRPFWRSLAEAGHNDFFFAAAKTDDAGRYRFSAKQIRGSLPGHVILARHEDRAAILLEPGKGEAPQELPDLILGPAILVQVDVANAHGEPVVGAVTELRVKYDGMGIADLLLGDVSDDAGRLSFLALPDGPKLALELHLVAAGYPDVEQDLDMEMVRRGEVVRIVLATGMTVRGRVVGKGGSPPTQALLRIARFDPDYDRHELLEGPGVKADPAGNFEVCGVPPENARLLVFNVPSKAAMRPWDLKALPPQEIAFEDGHHGDVQSVGLVQLGAWSSIEGVVLDPFGAPVERADVTITTKIEGLRGLRLATDESGRFTTKSLPVCAYRVRVSHEFEDVGERKAQVDGVNPGDELLTIRLTGASTLVLRFHPAGKPRERLLTKHASLQLAGEDIWAGWSGRSSMHLVRYEMEPGSWTLLVEVDGHQETTVGPFEIHADRETVIDVEFVPE